MSLARALGARADVTVAAPRGSRLLDEAAALPGVRTVALQFKGGPAQQWRTLRQLRALLRAEAFDVVHVNGSADHRLCMLAAALRAVAAVHGLHPAQWPPSPQPGRAPAGRAGDRPRHLRQPAHLRGHGPLGLPPAGPAAGAQRRGYGALPSGGAGRGRAGARGIAAAGIAGPPGGRQPRRHGQLQELAGHGRRRGFAAAGPARTDRRADRRPAARRRRSAAGRGAGHGRRGGVHRPAARRGRCWRRWMWVSCCRRAWRRFRLPAAR
ncbi:glycosyltransferase [Achromobacter insuavis]